MTTPTKTRKKPAAKADAATAEADAMHAEAMAAPLGLPLSTDALAALERESPGGPMTIIAAVRKSYDACKTITKGDCEALLEQWHGEAREAVYGPLVTWLGTKAPVPDPVIPALAGAIERDGELTPEEAQAAADVVPPDPFDASFGPVRDNAAQENAQHDLTRWSKGTITFPAITDEPAGEPEAAEPPAEAAPEGPRAAIPASAAAEDWDALRKLGEATAEIPVTTAETETFGAVDGETAA